MPDNLCQIKEQLECHLGQKVMLTAQAGRKRKTERKGILRETYHAVFVVDLDQNENAFERVSYSYADVLTEAVEILFYDEENASTLKLVKNLFQINQTDIELSVFYLKITSYKNCWGKTVPGN